MKLRPMTMADADFMLMLKNYSETRNNAILTSEEIKRDDHINWLGKNVQYFQVIMIDSERAGAIRIQDNEISIWLDREFRDNGIALMAINSVKEPGMTAKIVTSNLPSLRAFCRARFLPINVSITIPAYYIFRYEP